ncbi:hypothetical protein [Nostoc sp. UHCC 0251]|uniref:hypothetical protein n=1 Tax=Nostoc sp. UHCC 0251 TaxID=3110240 RepID=UPI002B1FB620|nr:hypothetical protein [Nostoc sp. UHCC 0251]MEA5622214.1 hypothetical protein [Nostoc sp. UHCC 0251]
MDSNNQPQKKKPLIDRERLPFTSTNNGSWYVNVWRNDKTKFVDFYYDGKIKDQSGVNDAEVAQAKNFWFSGQ